MVVIVALDNNPADPCMRWVVRGTTNGVAFSGELSRDTDYAHVSGPVPDADELTEALNDSPLYLEANEGL